jgi:hypothetical protein
MQFWVQASNPRVTGQFDAADQSLSEAVQTAFPLDAEEALVRWGPHYIVIGYHSEVSELVEDLVSLLNRMSSFDQGAIDVHWPCSTFAAVWAVEWSATNVLVRARFLDVRGVDAAALNAFEELSLGRVEFLAEWAQLLRVIEEGLLACGYGDSFPPLPRLRALRERLPAQGQLYVG